MSGKRKVEQVGALQREKSRAAAPTTGLSLQWFTNIGTSGSAQLPKSTRSRFRPSRGFPTAPHP
jgi:hypothetical protein